jgi:SAM-dependent methyltransferase
MALPAEQAKTIHRLETAARYLWAAEVAGGRAALDIGCGDGAGTSALSAAGSSPVLGVDSSPEAIERARQAHGDAARFEVGDPAALPVGEDEFDLITCFEVFEAAPDPDAVLGEVERTLKPGGLLLASLRADAEGERSVEALRRRFRSVAVHEGSRSVLVAAGNAALPAPLSSRPIGDLDALREALSQWEERARNAEAEVAVMRWEVRIAGEKLVALVNRLVQLENAPARRLRRMLRAQPARVSHAEISDAAVSEANASIPEHE